MEEAQSDIIEQLLDQLERKNRKADKLDSHCQYCKNEFRFEDMENEVCSCGSVPSTIPVLPIYRLIDIKQKRSVYKPVTYGRSIILSVMGLFLPIEEAKFRSLLWTGDVPGLVSKMKVVQEQLKIETENITTEMTRLFLKKLGLGCYYRYTCYLTKKLNPFFIPVSIPPETIDKVLIRYRSLARVFATQKEKFNRAWRSKRKSLPHVPTIFLVIFENMNLHQYTRDLPRMRSKRREHRIRAMAQYLYELSNFLTEKTREEDGIEL